MSKRIPITGAAGLIDPHLADDLPAGGRRVPPADWRASRCNHGV